MFPRRPISLPTRVTRCIVRLKCCARNPDYEDFSLRFNCRRIQKSRPSSSSARTTAGLQLQPVSPILTPSSSSPCWSLDS